MNLTIETDRLYLRPMRAEDLPGLLTVFSDPSVMEAFNAQPFDESRMRSWIERNLAHQRRYGYGLSTVVLKATDEIIGDCGLEHMTEAPCEAELGYDLRSDVWGQGLATEAACAVRDHARTALGLARLFSLIRVGNQASRRVAEKIGMDLDATIERFGVPYWIYMTVLRQEQT
jgi:ribosomal-protein-alanine N-acetyltransferase